MGRRYTGGPTYVERIAHTLANDIVKYFTGKNGIFLSTILFVSGQGGTKEISAMDFDGRAVRQLTSHKSIAISPNGANGRIAYTSYVRLFPLLWTMDMDGNNKREVPTGVDLNASPSLTADGAQIAFAGSASSRPRRRGRPTGGRSSTRRISPERRRSTSWTPRGPARAG
jgi:TolB protein